MDADLRRLFSRDELHERARGTVTDEYGFQSISSVIEADDHICVYLRQSCGSSFFAFFALFRLRKAYGATSFAAIHLLSRLSQPKRSSLRHLDRRDAREWPLICIILDVK